MEAVIDFLFVGSKIPAHGDCSHEIKRHLLLRRKVMTNLDSILKSRDFADKGPSSQSCDFSSSYFACRIPGMTEPGGLPSMGMHRVGHD